MQMTREGQTNLALNFVVTEIRHFSICNQG